MSTVEWRAHDIGQPEAITTASQLLDAEHGGLSIVIGLEGLALGGVPINALDLATALIGRGNSVNVFAIDERVRVSILPQAERRGVPITLLPSGSATIPRARQIHGFADRHDADVIHVFAPWLGPAATMAALSRKRCAPIVTNWMMENVRYTPQGTSLILGTKMLQEEAQRTHRSRVWLLEPPVDLTTDCPDDERARHFRQANGIADDEIAVIVVSRLDVDLKAEGIGYAIRAIARLNRPEVRMVVVGDGNAFDQIQQQAQQVNAELGRRAVILTGAMHDPRPAYAGADVTLGMGGSALRALAHAKPLIVLGKRGFARIFEPESVSYFDEFGFFGYQSVDDPIGHLAAQIRKLLEPDLRRLLGDFGRAEVRARFGLEASAAELEVIYRESLHSRRSVSARFGEVGYLTARSLVREARRAIRSAPPRWKTLLTSSA